MRVYDRFWSDQEIRGDAGKIGGLRIEPTLFRLTSGPTEAIAHGGVLTLKAVTRGSASYRFAGNTLSTRPGRALVVPASASHATRVGAGGADILTLYFPRQMAADALDCLAQPAERLLDGATASPDILQAFPPHLRAADDRLAALIAQLSMQRCLQVLEDLAFAALQSTVVMALDAARATARTAASRASVRRELFRRACVARDLIEERLDERLGLDELAGAACLSPFHLHRVFHAAFAETPSQMQRRLRMDRAKALLGSPRRSIAEVAYAVGFDDGSAFSRSFRAVVGCTPRAWRRDRAG